MTTTTTTARKTAAAALLALGLFTAACGGGSGEDSASVASLGDDASAAAGSGAGSGADDTAEQAREFAECMRDHGIELPDPDPETGEFDLADMRGGVADLDSLETAMDACRDLAPPQLSDRDGLTDEQLESLGDLAECMREQGIDVPDPDPDSGFGPGLGETGIDPSSPDFQDALDTCRDAVNDLIGGDE
ncbi:hypothetical protein [Streptomyces aidingensis]|uniref:Secreted protein n=1 Tax=Streptomyces aidingensis TaxID=910347 RepID=A0A1I1UYK8_9ACTN|nr:hypothetical protein [Streptomyces aidingensis]SFD75774.1 hypothetical protein SAMN05421773_12811 [Streptomyces aidingensis]